MNAPVVRLRLRSARLDELLQRRRRSDEKHGYSVTNSEGTKKVGGNLSFNQERATNAEERLIQVHKGTVIDNLTIKALATLPTLNQMYSKAH